MKTFAESSRLLAGCFCLAALLAPHTVAAAGKVFQDCPQCPQMVEIPPGKFIMGASSAEGGDDERPQHWVKIDYAFAVGVYEVTFDEFDACAMDGGCGGLVANDNGWGRGNRPVINVRWEDAQAYVQWLSGKTGESYRLLSESEWEYVARAGTRTAYHFGGSLSSSQANYWDSGARNKTVPVGSYPPNAFGLHDMHGNVAEWVQDCWHDHYDGAPDDGSAREKARCRQRVLRGGSWHGKPEDLRSAYRSRSTAGNRSGNSGFRVARTLTP